MTYKTKVDVISHAQALGSNATTFAGARRYILANIKPIDFGEQQYPRYTWGRKAPVVTFPRGSKGWIYPVIEGVVTPRERWLRARWIDRIETRLRRTARERGIWALDDAAELAETMNRSYCSAAETALRAEWPYKRSQSGWAGGNHSVAVTIGSPSASGGSEKVWSSNGKWSGSDSYARINTDLYTLLMFPTLMTHDGLALCHAEPIGQREWRVKWIEQSTGFGLKTVDGYLIRGYHVRAPGIASARAKAAKSRAAAVTATLRERQARKAKTAGLAAMKSLYVAVEDSIRGGNCTVMTNTFASAIWAKLGASGPCAVRADVVLMERDDFYTRRAVGAAMTHQAVA